MNKPKRKGSRLTTKSSDQDIIRWTESRDIFDRLEKGVSEVVEDRSDLDQVLREAIFQDNTAQLNMRLPPAMKAVLSKLARQRTTDATSLARIWLAERGWNRNSKLGDSRIRRSTRVPTVPRVKVVVSRRWRKSQIAR